MWNFEVEILDFRLNNSNRLLFTSLKKNYSVVEFKVKFNINGY